MRRILRRGGRFSGRLVAFLLVLGCALAAGAEAREPRRLVWITVDGLGAGAGGGLPGAVLPLAGLPPEPYVAACEWTTGAPRERTGYRTEWGPGLRTWRGTTLAEALTARGVRSLALPADPATHAGTGLERGFTEWPADAQALPDSARLARALDWLHQPGERFVWLALERAPAVEVWRRGDGRAPGLQPAAERAQGAALADLLQPIVAGLADVPGAVIVLSTGAAASAASGAGVLTTLPPEAGLLPGPPARERRLPEIADAIARWFTGRGFAVPAPRRAPGVRAGTGRDACRDEARRLGAVSPPDTLVLAALDSLVIECAGDSDVVIERAGALSRAGREREAARAYKEFLDMHPWRDDVRIAYAEHLLRYQRGDVAEDVLAPIDPTAPMTALAGWRLAIARMGDGAFEDARATAQRVSRLAILTPWERDLLPMLDTLVAYDARVTATPRDAALRYAFADRLAALHLVDLASGQLQTAQVLEPASAEPDYRLARALLEVGRTKNAIATLRRGTQREPGHHASWLLLADACLGEGDRAGARQALEAAARTGPLEPRDHYNLACLLATSGDVGGAWTELERAVDAGYAERETLAGDPDLEALRRDPRFAALLGRVRAVPTPGR